MKAILILLCVLTLASCGSRSGDRAKQKKLIDHPSYGVDLVAAPPNTLSCDIVLAFANANKARFISSTLVVIKHSSYADSLIYWTYPANNDTWQFLDLK